VSFPSLRGVTYSIVARDPSCGEMGLATQSQAFAVGSSVPWAEPGFGVIATQSVAEPYYGELGLDLLRGGLTASEALAALRSIDPHPERRQLAMVDAHGGIDVYTGDGCVAEAGHRIAEHCGALANMVASPDVWVAMVEGFEAAGGPLAHRLVAALEAAEEAGGDIRGQRSAAVTVVRAERTGRPWRDQVVDLRVDDHDGAVAELRRLHDTSDRYHRAVRAFELAIDGDPSEAIDRLGRLDEEQPLDPDMAVWMALALTLAGREDEAAALVADLGRVDVRFVDAFARFGTAGLVPEGALTRVLATAR
jgi:uncharacterized Ntn-hydrolase superfamily protein